VGGTHDGEAEATRSSSELFKWSGYVHVGAGAEDCPQRTTGACVDPTHFHAWVCLPNTFQIRDIVDKARAAKARKRRALRDPESDVHAVLEDELDELRREHYDELVDALARGSIDKRLPEIVRELQEDERFEHYAQDAEEYRRQSALPEDQRDAEEWERLQADMVAYSDALQKAVDEEIERERERLRALPPDDVVEEERRARIDSIGTEVYLHTYYTWVMFVGARQPSDSVFSSKRKFAAPEDLKSAPPEVVTALRDKIKELESATTERGEAAGN
jgi:hypothetical protein